jgi:hypothetical protein
MRRVHGMQGGRVWSVAIARVTVPQPHFNVLGHRTMHLVSLSESAFSPVGTSKLLLVRWTHQILALPHFRTSLASQLMVGAASENA